MPDRYGVTTYAVIAEPLLVDGAIHFTAAVVLPGVALTPVGATGAPTMIDTLAVDCGPDASRINTATLNV